MVSGELISWRKVVSTVHQALIKTGTKLIDATVGEFEFGGIKTVQDVVCVVNPNTKSLLLLDKDSLPDGEIIGTYNGKAGLDWLTFTNYIDSICIDKGVNPDEVTICHLEVRSLNCVSELEIFVDVEFKSLCITDKEQRINGTSLGGLLSPPS